MEESMMHIQFAELPMFDQERGKAFYIDHLDCRVVADQPMSNDGWRWIELGFPGADTALHFVRRKDEAPPEGPDLMLGDNDIDVAVQRLKSRGVEIIAEPEPAPW
jgi:predicted enzyme related to lactoylglutathione lyase